MTASRTLLIDARCLQHPDFARRGIGRHIETMLHAAPGAMRRDFAMTGLIDQALPPLREPVAALFDRLTTTAYAASRSTGSVFLNPAPLSFSHLPLERLLHALGVLSIAVVLDFIPLEFPQLYLATPAARRQYFGALAALRRYDRFLPISRATARRLDQAIPGMARRSTVTGVAVRASLMPQLGGCALPLAERIAEIFVLAGDDPRKNPEVAARAHAKSAALQEAGIRLRFAAVHDPATQKMLAALHAANGGAAALLEFAPMLDEASLARAYSRALLVVAPSRAEGFSLPIIESMAHGTPVLAADEPAQAELVADAADRFAPDDAAGLRAAMELLSLDPARWQEAVTRQAGLWQNFTPRAVAARFWRPLLQLPAPALSRPALLDRAKPRIALLSPLPPAPSGCADHAAALLAALTPLAEVTAFSDTASPRLPSGVNFGGRADASVMKSPRHDAVITVIGNTPLHRSETRLLRDHGAAAIVHDARLGDLYRSGFGDAAALGIAIAESEKNVTFEQLDAWEADQATMPLRFLGEIAAAATPMIVHAASTAQWVAAKHGIAPRFLPFPPYRLPDPASMTEPGRQAARRRLGIPACTSLIVTLGHIQHDRAPETLIRVASALRQNMKLVLAFAGPAKPALVTTLRHLARTFGIETETLILHAELISEAAYRDYLAAADCAIQLRRAPPGSISGALMDAIAAGVPAVASATLADAIAPPSYVYAVPDDAAPEAIAASVRQALDQGRATQPVATQPVRERFLAERSMARYAAQLLRTVLH